MAALYNTLPPISHTLRQFTVRANRLYEDEDYSGFIRCVLTGEYDDSNGNKRQVFIDPIRNSVDEDHPLRISRDYDSAIGISEEILVDGPISVYAVPHPTFALTSSIHMTHTVIYEGQARQVEFHHIPNFEFGYFGARHHLNIFFPKLWNPERSNSPLPHQLTEDQRAFWYENGLRPAILHLLGHATASEWPATYATEKVRAEKSRGGYAWSTKIIRADVVGELLDRVRFELETSPHLDEGDENISWAKNFFVMHTIRGVKHATMHQADPLSARHYLAEFFRDAQLVDNAPQLGDWYIDMGIQIISDKHECLQWITATHHLVAQQALHISDLHVERITQINSSKYSRDLASHLTSISGFRIVPGARAEGEFQAKYLQAYTTDKSVVYNTDGSHHAKFLTTREALGPIQPTKTIDGIHDIYDKARDANASSARLEARVPYQFATLALLEFDPAVIRSCLCSFTREEWWNFRIIRIMAISQTLSLQEGGDSVNRFTPEALLLTAACVWLLNGLHARPEDGPASRNLMEAILPITEADDANLDVLAYNVRVCPAWQHEDEESADEDDPPPPRRAPYNPYGCIFFRRLVLGDVPRARFGGRVLSEPSFKFWFDGMSIAALKAKYQKSGIVDRNVIAATRFTTAKRKLPIYVNLTNAPEPNLFSLAAQGHTLVVAVDDDASDVEDRESPPPEYGPQDIDATLSTLWRQFVSDLTSKSPNQRGMTNPSYLKLNDVQRQSGKEDPYMHLWLSEIFTAVYYKNASSTEWKTSFKWLFPPLGHKISSAVQNYKQSPYYQQWMMILERNRDNNELIEDIRKELWKRLRKWSWMPNAQVDKMWPTSAKKSSSNTYTRWPEAPGRPPAPHILLKQYSRPFFAALEADMVVDN